jgi:hypothetical protein
VVPSQKAGGTGSNQHGKRARIAEVRSVLPAADPDTDVAHRWRKRLCIDAVALSCNARFAASLLSWLGAARAIPASPPRKPTISNRWFSGNFGLALTVERKLVLRLASLLWRLRRIISIETDLLQIQAEIRRTRLDEIERASGPHVINGVAPSRSEDRLDQERPWPDAEECDHVGSGPRSISAREVTYCFLRLGNLDNGAFDRLARYTALWKQTAQTLFLLQSIRHR